MLALYGMAWTPVTVAPNPERFVRAVAAWFQALSRCDGGRLDDHADFEVKPGSTRSFGKR